MSLFCSREVLGEEEVLLLIGWAGSDLWLTPKEEEEVSRHAEKERIF